MALHPNSARPKVRCPMCKRKVKDLGLVSHYIAYHDIPERVARVLAEQDMKAQELDRRTA